MERTLVILKPDAVGAGLTGKIQSRFERRGWTTQLALHCRPPVGLLRQHYAEHRSQHYFTALIEFMRSGPVVVLVVSGDSVVTQLRQLVGATNPKLAKRRTIRGRWRKHTTGGPSNLIHASDSPAAAERELKLWMPYLRLALEDLK